MFYLITRSTSACNGQCNSHCIYKNYCDHMMPIAGVDWTFHTGVTGNCYMYFNLLYDRSELGVNKLALLWGEAQKKIAYSYLKVT